MAGSGQSPETAPRRPRIGLVAESDLSRHLLAGLLDEAGYELHLSLDTDRLATHLAKGAAQLDTELDAWLLAIEEHAMQRALDLLVEYSDTPLLVNDDIPPTGDAEAHQYWKRRLLEKLELVAVPGEPATSETTAASAVEPEQVWVLAASFGGPEAVKTFLDTLPALPLALVYGQHIEARFDSVLTAAVSSNPAYPIRLLRGRGQLRTGEVAVVPVDRALRFLPRGEVVETRRRWKGQYQPSLDQVIAELARLYRDRLGVIVFSGMCNDGEVGCRVAAACNSTVWVQTPDSCMSPDMPNAALSTGCVSYQGTPVELAQALAQRYGNNTESEKPRHPSVAGTG